MELFTAEIMPPERSNLVLTTDVPHIELDILIGHGLDVETDCWNGGDVLAELELVKYSCLASCIQTKHEQSHLLRSEDLPHHLRELASHDAF